MGWKVIIAPSAQADLEDIVRYIASHNPIAATQLGNALITRGETLAHFPEMGRVVPEFNHSKLREVIHRSYRIIYRVQHPNQIIEIVRFWHSARGFPRISRDLES